MIIALEAPGSDLSGSVEAEVTLCLAYDNSPAAGSAAQLIPCFADAYTGRFTLTTGGSLRLTNPPPVAPGKVPTGPLCLWNVCCWLPLYSKLYSECVRSRCLDTVVGGYLLYFLFGAADDYLLTFPEVETSSLLCYRYGQ